MIDSHSMGGSTSTVDAVRNVDGVAAVLREATAQGLATEEVVDDDLPVGLDAIVQSLGDDPVRDIGQEGFEVVAEAAHLVIEGAALGIEVDEDQAGGDAGDVAGGVVDAHLDGVLPPQIALGPDIATEAQRALDAIFVQKPSGRSSCQ